MITLLIAILVFILIIYVLNTYVLVAMDPPLRMIINIVLIIVLLYVVFNGASLGLPGRWR